MANVFLTDEAYARLKAAKRKNESFSKVVMEFVPQKVDLGEFFGAWKGVDTEKEKARIRKERGRF